MAAVGGASWGQVGLVACWLILPAHRLALSPAISPPHHHPTHCLPSFLHLPSTSLAVAHKAGGRWCVIHGGCGGHPLPCCLTSLLLSCFPIVPCASLISVSLVSPCLIFVAKCLDAFESTVRLVSSCLPWSMHFVATCGGCAECVRRSGE
jgi:hypothetical protein